MLIITIIKQASFSIMSYLQVHWLPHVSISLLLSLSFKWSRSVKDNYMRGKATLKKFFSESFCKLGEKKKKKQEQAIFNISNSSNSALSSSRLLHGHSEVLVKIISASTSPSPFLNYLNLTWQQPWTQLTPLLLTWLLHPLLLPPTSTAPSWPLPPGSCHLCKL